MNQRPSEEEYAGSSGEYIRLVPDGNIIDILLAQEKQMTELLASLTESRKRISVCGRKMDTKRSCEIAHYRRGTRHDLPPAPVRKRGPDAADQFRSGIVHASFRKLDNRAIG